MRLKFKKWGVSLFYVSLFLFYGYTNSLAQDVPKAEYTSSGLRDPLKSPIEAERNTIEPFVSESIENVFLPEDFLVQGIVWGAEPVKAIINDLVVGKGDTILGARVLDIKKNGVYLFYKGKKFTVKPQ